MAPETIGRYQIKKELGRGGMATVYRAYDPSFERDVAIKVLPQAFLHDELFRARFEREAKTVAALEHSAIVPVYDFGEQDGQPYIVMRMMPGGDLNDKLKEGPLSVEEAAEIVIHLASGLEAAHSRGIVHRDLKPGNILFDSYGNALLSDFGIARLTQGSQTLTGENIIGTPAYMSPEQVQGDKELDGRSDLYALGILFYQMLVGDTPYQATTPAKVMMKHVLEPVPSLAQIKPDLSPLMENWLQRALAKDPDERFSSASEMAEALQAASRGREHPTLINVPDGTALSHTRVSSPAATVVGQRRDEIGTGTHPPQVKPKRRWLPFVLTGFVILGIGALAILGLAFIGYQGTGPLAMLASPTQADTATPLPPTETAIPASATPEQVVAAATSTPEQAAPTETALPPSETPEPTATNPPDVQTVGGADKIAFLNANDIWLMNVDGSDLEQLTSDGAEKHGLSWSPDGLILTFISGKCVQYIDIESGRQDIISCFETAELLEIFEISPDGTQVAISLNRELYLVPYDLDLLREARYHTDLREISECPGFAPLKTFTGSDVPAKFAKWSNDGERLTVMHLAAQGGLQVDLIRIFQVGDCQTNPRRLDEFPPPRFQVDNYDETPYLQNFGHDGGFLYALTSYTRNDGYGHLYLYNADLHKAETQVNPINGDCCYRDPAFSPDGHYLIFAFQPYEAGAKAELYLVPYGTIGTGATYEPLPIPDEFFTNPKAKPQPVLRPAVSVPPE